MIDFGDSFVGLFLDQDCFCFGHLFGYVYFL